jgi:TatD DNase family protein
MQIIDTHAHLYVNDFKEDIASVLGRATAEGVSGIILPNIDSGTVDDMLELAKNFPICHAAMGLHPCSVKEDNTAEYAEMEKWLGQRSFAGIGETGLDFHWDTSYTTQQYESFELQVGWAKSLGIPIIIHSRKSTDECIAVIKKHQDGRLTGVFHCFSGTVEQAREITDLGLYLGIGGVVTYKNGGLEPVLQTIGMDRVVLETDSPYLSPVPNRGKRNEPSYLKHVVDKLAAITGLSQESIGEVTTANAKQLFNKSFHTE